MKVLLATLALTAALAAAYQSDRDLIIDAEGISLCEYNQVVCYGFNLNKTGAKQEVEDAGGNYQILKTGGCTSHEVCESLLDTDIAKARNTVYDQYGDQISCPAAQAVVVDMAYNMGAYGLS